MTIETTMEAEQFPPSSSLPSVDTDADMDNSVPTVTVTAALEKNEDKEEEEEEEEGVETETEADGAGNTSTTSDDEDEEDDEEEEEEDHHSVPLQVISTGTSTSTNTNTTTNTTTAMNSGNANSNASSNTNTDNSTTDGYQADNDNNNNNNNNDDDDDDDRQRGNPLSMNININTNTNTNGNGGGRRNQIQNPPSIIPTTTTTAMEPIPSSSGGVDTTSLVVVDNDVGGGLGLGLLATTTMRSTSNVCKVIKGEIHNVLNIMRTDAHFSSPLRFVEEVPSDEQHPLVLRFSELHRTMTEWELRYGSRNNNNNANPDARLYLPPFCVAIQSRDISAKVTGAALQSLQKFLLYGFLKNEGPNAFTTIAKTLLMCTFEESSSAASSSSSSSSSAFAANAASANANANANATKQQQQTAAARGRTNGSSAVMRRGGGGGAGRSGFGGGGVEPNNSNSNSDSGNHHHHHHHHDYSDEQVVLRLLELSALIVRSASSELQPDVVVGLLDVCLHVSHRAKRASWLLKSAASDAMKQIVLEVFSKPNLARKREDILAKISGLLNPKHNSDAYVVNSLTLVNFALETLTPEKLTAVEIGILKKDLCKYLLSWSTTHDLVILSLTMRVIFNLFQTIRNHLKVPLEVFLTSVHLRILEQSSSNPEEREVALESLLEFCKEPALIKDLYLNYDCDVQCTNLYATICESLANVTAPMGLTTQQQFQQQQQRNQQQQSQSHSQSQRRFQQQQSQQQLRAADESTANAAISSTSSTSSSTYSHLTKRSAISIAHKAAIAASEVPMNVLCVQALECLLTIIESIARRCRNHNQHHPTSSSSSSAGGGGGNNNNNNNSNNNNNNNNSQANAPRYRYGTSASMSLDDDLEMSEEDLQERKRRKAALSRVAATFNKNPDSRDWINLGIESSVMEDTVDSVALALFLAPGLDKNKLGTYLSRGPYEKYPFHGDVRLAFVKNFDFTNCGRFTTALRRLLNKLRLPGEAQQIDRIMQVFSDVYYEQQGKKSVFRDPDAVFLLAFSTIMLNTDLHNPNIKNRKRMTRQQFIRNLRGINAGGDLPEAMLAWVYTDIRENELQVQREIGEFISHSDVALDAENFRGAWGDMLRRNVAVAVFTTADEARRSMFEVGVHEKDMFLTIARPALRAISSAFIRSWDDGNIVSALKGLEQMAMISTFFGLDDLLNEILSFLLSQGRDYIIGCVALEYSGIESGAPISLDHADDDESTMASMSIVDTDSPIPHALLRVREIADIDPKKVDINGAAAYRGLIALNMGLRIVRTLFPRVNSAWPELIEVFGCLRDARALPAGLSDLDDFADSEGNVLPLSLFARKSQKRLDEVYHIKTAKKETTKQGWFRGVFGRGKPKEAEERPDANNETKPSSHRLRSSKISKNARILLQIAEWTEIEKFMVLGPHLRLPLVKQSVRGLLGSIHVPNTKPSPTYEQHQAFALELAARALLASDDRAPELFPMFLEKFKSLAKTVQKLKRPIQVPFLMERVIATILRSSIHLYKIPTMREQLLTSLALIPTFPKPFLGHIADRTACGLAIIWRSYFSLFESQNDLQLIGDLFCALTTFELGRGLIFDGIASTIELTLPDSSISNILIYEETIKEKETLSIPASATLQRVLFTYIHGEFREDLSITVPAVVCVEKLYNHVVQLVLIDKKNDPMFDPEIELPCVPDLELWHGVSVAFYTACINNNEEISKKGLEACQRHVLVPDLSEIPDVKWTALINTMINKQPPLSSHMPRVNALSIIAQLMVQIFPSLTSRESNFEVLTKSTKNVAMVANENMENRRSPDMLFDLTVTIVTHLAVQLASAKFGGDKRYCKWASDLFVRVLEKNGATKAMDIVDDESNESDEDDDDEQKDDESLSELSSEE